LVNQLHGYKTLVVYDIDYNAAPAAAFFLLLLPFSLLYCLYSRKQVRDVQECQAVTAACTFSPDVAVPPVAAGDSLSLALLLLLLLLIAGNAAAYC
jgi:hypothetical protein